MAVNIYLSELLDRYGAVLPEKQFRILDGYYNNDLSLSEIAENEGISRQGVSDFVKRGDAVLHEYEEKLRFCDKCAELKALAEKVHNGEGNIAKLFEAIDNF